MRKLKLFFACLLMSLLSIGQMWGAEEIASGTFNGKNAIYTEGWSTNGTGKGRTDCIIIGSGENITSPSIDLSQYESITISIKARRYGSLSNSKATIAVTFAGESIGSVDATGTNATTALTDIQHTVITSTSKTGTFVFTCTNATSAGSSHGAGINTITISGVEKPVGGVSKPMFSLASGNYAGAQSVELTCETSGATIYYTTDGSDPDNTKTQYTSAIAVSETKTIKAIAYVGTTASNVATATYNIFAPLTTIEAIFDRATDVEGTPTDVAVTFNNWVITGVNGSNAYLTDGENGLVIYEKNHNFVVGNVLSGTVLCKVQLFKQSAELTALTSATAGLSVATGGVAPVNTLDADGINALSGLKTGSIIKINGECSVNNTNYFIAGVQLYKSLYDFTSTPPADGKEYNCTGVFVQYNSVKEILPRSAADIEEVVDQSAPEAPEFNLAAGTYTAAQNVTITCATEGAAIYYTTDGSTPTNTSALYYEPVAISETSTLKAVAIKNDLSSSVTSAVYTIHYPLTTMQAIFDAATSTATPTYITFNEAWVVTGVAPNGKNVYITDGTKGMILYNGGGNMGLEVGNTLSGTVQRSLKLYNGSAELDGFTTEGLTKGTADVPAVQVLDAEGVAALSGVNTGSLIKISGEASQSGTKYYIAGVQLYTALNTEYTNPTAGKNYNCTGVYAQFNTTKEILPRSAADVEEIVVKHTVTYEASPAYGSLAIYEGENLIASGAEVIENTILTIEVAPADGYKLTAVTVNGNAYTEATLTLTENVTIAASFEENLKPVITSFVLSEIGDETSYYTDGSKRIDDKVFLPSTAATCSKTFMGWSENASCAVAPEYAPGAEYTLKADNKLYAVYAVPGSTSYVEASLASLTESDVFVIVGNNGNSYALANNNGTGSAPAAVAVAVSNSKISGDIDANIQWNISGNATDGYIFYPNGSTASWLYCTNTNNGVRVGTGDAKHFTINSDYLYESETTKARYLGIYNSQDWRCYDAINSNIKDQSFAFYKKVVTNPSDYSTDCPAAPATLQSIAIGGTATALEYNDGDEFDPAGLVVTGHYSDNSDAVISEGITWEFDPATLTVGTTSVSVTATVGSVTSDAVVVNGLTVSAASTPAGQENVVILAMYDSKYYAMSTNYASSAFGAIAVEYDGTQVTVPSEEAKTAIQWTKTTEGDNTTFQTKGETPMYMKGTSDGAALTLNANVCNWSWDATNEYYYIGSRTFFYQNTSGGVFKNYATSNLNKTGYSDKAQVIVIDPANIVVVVPTTHAVSYNANGGTLISGETAIAPAQVAEGATVTVAANVYEKDGFMFAGWLYGETVYQAGQTFGMPTEDVELVAQWNPVSVSDYVLVTDVAQLQAGDKIIIVAADYNVAAGSAAATYRNTVEIAKTNDKSHLIFGASMPTEFTLGIMDGGYAFADATGYMYESAAKSVKTQAEPFAWTISIDAEAIATISADNELRYNNGSPRFTTYASGQQDLQIYRKPSEFVEARAGLTVGRYYTICMEKNIMAVKNASFWSLSYKDAETATEVYLVEETAPLVAGKPYIFQAEAATLDVIYGDKVVATPVENGALRGTFEDIDATEFAALTGNPYLLINNELRPRTTGNYLNAHRAYIEFDALTVAPTQNFAPGKRVRAIPMQPQTATGIGELNLDETPMKLIINGQLFILRGEKMFNANGQLVK